MNKRWILLMILILVLSMATPVLAADGNVIYSGNAGQFIFEPGSEHSPTDLFPNFKDVMPGDTLTQNIVVKNNAKKNVRISMRALGAHEDSKDFLSKLNLYVEKVTDTPLFEAPADQTAQLTEWRELGVLAAGGEAELLVGLQVPTDLDNANKNKVGSLDWEFLVEELEDPKTGDNIKYWPWLIGFASSGILILVLIKKRRKDNEYQAD